MKRPVLTLALAISVACVSDPRDDNSFETGMSSSASTTTTSDATSTGPDSDTMISESDGSTSSVPVLDVAADETDGTTPEIAEVFGHSGDILYRMDPETKGVTAVGAFSGCSGSIIDIALDADSRMFGTSFSALYEIDKMTGACTLIAEGDYPTSLSFVPAGTVDLNAEALVGFVDEQYIRIDVNTGGITNISTLSDGLASSGDIVSVKDGGTYLTVYGPGCEDNDCIIQIDPADGSIIEHYGPVPYDQVFGLAFWAGRAYGFARGGELFEVEFVGDSVLTQLISIPDAPSNLEFFGAGSTTSAPPAAG